MVNILTFLCCVSNLPAVANRFKAVAFFLYSIERNVSTNATINLKKRSPGAVTATGRENGSKTCNN